MNPEGEVLPVHLQILSNKKTPLPKVGQRGNVTGVLDYQANLVSIANVSEQIHHVTFNVLQ